MFSNSNLPFETIIYVLYWWSHSRSTPFSLMIKEQEGLTPATTTRWRNKLLQLVARDLRNEPVLIGGPGFRVAVDETKFKGKTVLGGICWESGEVFVCVIPDLSRGTIFRKLREYVLPGSEVHTDGFASYATLAYIRGAHYFHKVVIHSREFKNRRTGACTNTIESVWAVMKQWASEERGFSRGRLETFLEEVMWRSRQHGDIFEAVLALVRRFHPV